MQGRDDTFEDLDQLVAELNLASTSSLPLAVQSADPAILESWLQKVREVDGSDLLLVAGAPPVVRASGKLLRVNEEAQEITSILDETSVTGESPVFARARQTARLADSYLWRFSHILSQALLGTDTVEIRHIEVLRMRLMRDYSGLWLLVYKPFFTRRAGDTLA